MSLGKVIDKKYVFLNGEKYQAYLKIVAAKCDNITIRPFIKKVEDRKKCK